MISLLLLFFATLTQIGHETAKVYLLINIASAR